MKTLIWTTCSRRGLTLIEVVAGLALMGTLVAAMLAAKSRFTGQHRHAQRVLIAVGALDQLLSERWPELSVIKVSARGEFENRSDMTWEAMATTHDAAEDWHSRVIRIEVFDKTHDADADPLVGVDLLAPAPAYPGTAAEADPSGSATDSSQAPASRDASPKASDPVNPSPHPLGAAR